MFITLPPFAASFPQALGEPGARYWRGFHLYFHRPWFLATFRVGTGARACRTTWGLCSDHDLVDQVEQPSNGSLVGLLCLLPPWSSPTGQWSSREVGSVWLVLDPSDGAEAVVFEDRAGVAFVPGAPHADVLDFPDRQLLVEISANVTHER